MALAEDNGDNCVLCALLDMLCRGLFARRHSQAPKPQERVAISQQQVAEEAARAMKVRSEGKAGFGLEGA